jgi:hypothetical protein
VGRLLCRIEEGGREGSFPIDDTQHRLSGNGVRVGKALELFTSPLWTHSMGCSEAVVDTIFLLFFFFFFSSRKENRVVDHFHKPGASHPWSNPSNLMICCTTTRIVKVGY